MTKSSGYSNFYTDRRHSIFLHSCEFLDGYMYLVDLAFIFIPQN